MRLNDTQKFYGYYIGLWRTMSTRHRQFFGQSFQHGALKTGVLKKILDPEQTLRYAVV